MPLASRRVAAVVVLVTTCALVTGCVASKEVRQAADRLDDTLGTPSWTDDITVESSKSGLSTDQVQTVVHLKDDATAEQIGGFVVDFVPIADDAGLGASYDLEMLRLERGDGTGLTIGWEETTDPATVVAEVSRWLAVVEEFGDDVSTSLGTASGNDYWIDLGQGREVTAVADAYDTIRADGLSEPEDSWTIGQQRANQALGLSGETLPTEEGVTTYRALVAAIDLLPPAYVATDVGLTYGPDYVNVGLGLLMPQDVTRENILPAAYGDDLWPTLHAQLDAIEGIVGDWSYLVQWAPVDFPDLSTILLSLLEDEEPIDNVGDPATAWSFGAYDYLR